MDAFQVMMGTLPNQRKRAISASDEETSPSTLASESTPSPKRRKPRPKNYVCEFEDCGKAFDVPAKLRDHVRTHTGERPYCCTFPDCGKSFAKQTSLKAHYNIHDPDFATRFQCEHCGKTFPRKQSYTQHVELQHVRATCHPCTWEGCDAKFTQPFELRRHMCTHTNKRPHPCEVPGCGSSFDWPNRLRFHMDTVHSEVKKYVCTEEGCEEKFVKWADLRAHIYETHPVDCTICNKEFSRASYLNAHMKSAHSNLQIPCTIEGCDAVFKSKKAMNTHIERVHKHIQPPRRHQCDICGMAFPYASVLAKHVPTHQKAEESTKRASVIDQLTGKDYADSNERQFLCPFEGCDRKYIYEYHLRRHLQSEAHKDDLAQFEAKQELPDDQPLDAAVSGTPVSIPPKSPDTSALEPTSPVPASVNDN